MDVSTTLAQRAYGAARPATKPTEEQALGHAVQTFSDLVSVGERVAIDSMAGRADAHSLVEALTQSELAVQTAVSVRDKVVEAYQEILRMPV
ncbi:flagellar hook-basal body complex protein FliE [Litoreibacter halocynthiae]|uniref:Flagellar hook-basal body complex protein FliE n=1 Tax=Litoreibacter halocynthiae TaxID=1242689 RepID=A0A4R7LE08_9RHOB|nr:flagellar hook-basal body complex protein FliE [Litoreibacter halocynthiae]TDT73853.1 flagellar hook-basal body complex protein FliE [Litoreibacter halocynthiae]